MEENKDRVQEEEQQVIQEQILPQKGKKQKKFWKSLLRLAGAAVVFGLIAGVTIVLTGSFLIKKLGLETTLRQAVGIGKATQAVSPTGAPSFSKDPGTTKSPTATETPTQPNLTVDPPKATPPGMISVMRRYRAF